MVGPILGGLAAADGGFSDIVTNSNFPGIVMLGAAALPGMFFVVRWMVRFQREFTDFYIAENTKLRERVDTLEEEGRQKDSKINTLESTVSQCQGTIRAHEATIERLEKILERKGRINE